jgi:hypothetical protein
MKQLIPGITKLNIITNRKCFNKMYCDKTYKNIDFLYVLQIWLCLIQNERDITGYFTFIF